MEYHPYMVALIVFNFVVADFLIARSKRMARLVVFSNTISVFQPAVMMTAGPWLMNAISLFFVGWALSQIWRPRP